mgnify:CR=1 FL=1
MNLPQTSLRLGAVLAAILICLGTQAQAEERFRLRGTHAERGAFRSEVTLEPKGEQVEVVRRVFWEDGSTTVYSGSLAQGDSLLQGELETVTGITGAIQPRGTETISWAFKRGERCSSRARDARGQSEARGERAVEAPPKAIVVEEAPPKAIVVEEAAREDAAEEEPSRLRKLRGRLIGLAKDEAADFLRKGASTKVDLGDYGHIGVRGKVAQVKHDQLSAAQRAALGRGPSVWIASEFQGGARLGTSTSIELGGAALGVGIRAGTELNYRVVERYPLRSGQSAKDWIRELGAQAWEAHSLPLSASEARELDLGSARTMSGHWNVVFSGSMSVGDPVEGHVSLGGSYQYRDHFRLEVERLSGQRVRIALLRTKTHTLSGSAKAVLGVAVKERIEELAPGAAFVTKKVGSEAEKYLRIKLELSGSAERERDFELSYELDLAQASQARAYERAIRGDWRQAERAGQLLLRRVGFERRRHTKVALGISKLASFERSSSTTRSVDRIRDAEGERVERAVTLAKGKKSSWFGKEEEHSFTAEGLWTIRPQGRDLTIRLLYRSHDERTRKSEFNRLRGALMAAGFPQAAELRLGDRETRAELELKLDQGGLNLLGRASRERALRAYAISVQAITGTTQLWLDPAKRSKVRLATKSSPGSKIRTKRYPTQRRHLANAERFAKALTILGAARTQSEREERFLGLAKTSRWELYEMAAMARLVGGPAHAEVRGSLGGREFR